MSMLVQLPLRGKDVVLQYTAGGMMINKYEKD
jgi:hypothetical protein